MEDITQGSDQWKQLRCGMITASKIAEVMSRGKNGTESTGYANYRAQIVAERLTGCVSEGYTNGYMQRGNEDESAARDCYSFATGNQVDQIAFIKHPTIECAGCSPDGLVSDDGLVEIKRKIPALHIAYLLKNEVPAEYKKQMTFQLACTGRKWVDFCSYCPELPENMQLFIVRFHRDDAAIADMEAAVIAFNQSVEKMITDLKQAVA